MNDQSHDDDGVDWEAGEILYPHPTAEPSAAEVAITAIRTRSDLLAFVLDSELTAFLRPSELVLLERKALALGVSVAFPDLVEDTDVRWFSGQTTKWQGTVVKTLAAIFDKLKNDTKNDTQKKTGKKTPAKRKLDHHAQECIRRYKARKDAKATMKTIVSDYVAEIPSASESSILKRLNDNSEKWKTTTKRR